jgi:sugar lactone lactonase YvrE
MLRVYAGDPGEPGSVDGSAAAARFYAPGGIALDSAGNLYVADSGNQTIRRITPAGVVTTIAGAPGQRGSTDGPGSAARFDVPSAICIDGAGNLYVADTYASTIRRIDRKGVVSTLAGMADSRGSADGPGPSARFSLPQGIAVDASGNLYVADTYNDTIRVISSAGVVTTLAGAAGQQGADDGKGPAARFSLPTAIAVGPAGDIYVADQANSTIRHVSRGGEVRTVAGAAGQNGTGDGAGREARFHEPFGIARERSGVLYVTDTGNHAVRAITRQGVVLTLTRSTGESADPHSTSGSSTAPAPPQLSYPGGVAARPEGPSLVFVTDGNAIFELHAPDLR